MASIIINIIIKNDDILALTRSHNLGISLVTHDPDKTKTLWRPDIFYRFLCRGICFLSVLFFLILFGWRGFFKNSCSLEDTRYSVRFILMIYVCPFPVSSSASFPSSPSPPRSSFSFFLLPLCSFFFCYTQPFPVSPFTLSSAFPIFSSLRSSRGLSVFRLWKCLPICLRKYRSWRDIATNPRPS